MQRWKMTEQRVALVTGGTRGIGRAITMDLAENGAHVAASYQSNKDAAQAMIDETAERGWSVSVHQMDVSDPDDCIRYANEVIGTYGHVDYLINNAGINIARTVRRMTIDEWRSEEHTSELQSR